MNQRIKDLLRETDATILSTMTGKKQYTFLEHDLERFIKLLGEDCLTQVDKVRDGLEADGEKLQALGADWVALAIARYFGLE